MKRKISLILLLLVVILLLTGKVFGATVPDEVITKAREVNSGHADNVIILQDTATSDYYIPYCESCSSNSNSWRYTTYKGVNCFICPSWHVLSCKKYSNGIFTDVGSNGMNTIASNSVLQESFNSISLVPVFADNNIVYSNVEGHTNGDTFFQNPPPLEVKVVAQAVERVGEVGLKQVTKEILAILPVILSVLVSLLAFSKGLSLLLSFLRKF